MDNETKNKFLDTYVLSTAGVVIMAVILIAVNVLSGAFYGRADLTEANSHTLSAGTRKLLQGMDTEVTLRFYYSRDNEEMPMYLKTYASQVEDLLGEYVAHSDGMLVLERRNPTPDSDDEDSANLDGVTGQSVGIGFGDRIYLGLAVSCLDKTVALPFLAPEREDLLEYDLSRAIYRVMNPGKPVVGVMSSLEVMGRQMPPMMAMQQQQEGSEPWIFIRELKRDFEVREIATDVDEIPGDIDVLLLAYASELEDATLFAIDQFVLGGGKLIAFLDPMSTVEQRNNPMNQMQYRPPGSASLDPLLSTWGVRLDTEKIVADMINSTRVGGRTGQPEDMPTVLSLTPAGAPFNEDDPAVMQLELVIMAFAGTFAGEPADGLTRDVLIATSNESQMVEKFMAQMPGDSIKKDFKSEEREQPLAIRLMGTFKTAFPDGKPGPVDADAEGEETGDAAAGQTWLTQSAEPNSVVLVADSDLLYNDFCARPQQTLFGGQQLVPISDNLSLIQNLVEQMSGDSNLISIRSRGTIARPFVEIRKRELEAQRRYQDRIQALEDDLSEVQRRLSELQRQKSDDQRFVISPEQQEELKRFQKRRAEVNQDLKELRKELRRSIDSLQNRLKWVNIALMPFLVIVGGIGFALSQRRRSYRK
jgi:ABC-type uncharacterized transport system involved in gliding motility auxiliary subunit